MAPIRIQLSRAKGWRMPLNTVKVDRSTKWGNPFPVGKEGPFERVAPDAEGATGFFRDMCHDSEVMMAAGYPFHREIRAELSGKNLACWCALPRPGQPDHCHAAVLLELANTETSTSSPSPQTGLVGNEGQTPPAAGQTPGRDSQ